MQVYFWQTDCEWIFDNHQKAVPSGTTLSEKRLWWRRIRAKHVREVLSGGAVKRNPQGCNLFGVLLFDTNETLTPQPSINDELLMRLQRM